MRADSSMGTVGLRYGGAAARDAPGRVLLLVTLSVLFAAGCSPAATPTPQARSLSGTFTLTQEDPVAQTVVGQRVVVCRGTGGYTDIVESAAVVVRNEDGTTVGSGRLVLEQVDRSGRPADRRFCRYTFEVDGLPDNDFYSVEVSHRGEVTFSRADLDAAGGDVDLTLGP